jgi:iron complex transport system permease protein
VAALLLGVGIGPVAIPPDAALAVVLHEIGVGGEAAFTPQQEVVLWAIRLPRVILAALVGAGMAVAGALLQAVFRNPLADPGLIGVSGGAAMGAVAVLVVGALPLGMLTLPAAAFLSGTLTTLLVYRCSQRWGRTDIATMLLVGLAVNAIAGACTGLLTYVADDAEVRSIVFWTMGGLSGAVWETLAVVAPSIALVLLLVEQVIFALKAAHAFGIEGFFERNMESRLLRVFRFIHRTKAAIADNRLHAVAKNKAIISRPGSSLINNAIKQMMPIIRNIDTLSFSIR